MTFPRLTDGTILLRAPALDDVPAVVAACQDGESQRWSTALPDPYTEQDARWFVGEHVPQAWAERSAVTWAMSPAGDPSAWAGHMTVRILDRVADLGEIGFLTAPWARGQGWTTRALMLACSFGFGEWRLGRIEWRAYVGNDASRRVAEKAGFVVEGVQRGRLVKRADRSDAWSAARLASDGEVSV